MPISQGLDVVISRGTHSARPVSGTSDGALYFETDTGSGFRWSGSTWEIITQSVNFADKETPSGTVNSSNTAFTLANTPSPGASLMFFVNGILQAVTVDYTLSTATITCTTAPETGAVLLASYRY